MFSRSLELYLFLFRAFFTLEMRTCPTCPDHSPTGAMEPWRCTCIRFPTRDSGTCETSVLLNLIFVFSGNLFLFVLNTSRSMCSTGTCNDTELFKLPISSFSLFVIATKLQTGPTVVNCINRWGEPSYRHGMKNPGSMHCDITSKPKVPSCGDATQVQPRFRRPGIGRDISLAFGLSQSQLQKKIYCKPKSWN